jgi:hypothetical protein
MNAAIGAPIAMARTGATKSLFVFIGDAFLECDPCSTLAGCAAGVEA